MTSERTINQVRAILSKLDRSIDEARERRTHPAPPASAPVHKPAAHAAPAAQPERLASPAHPAQSAQGAVRPPSPFGRAQPLNRPSNQSAWRA